MGKIPSSCCSLLPFLFHFLSLSSAYTLPTEYFIYCGSDYNTTYFRRTFIGDSNRKNSLSFTLTGQSSPVKDTNNSAETPLLYQTARVFKEKSSYEFKISSSGTYLVRLHFFPFTSSGANNNNNITLSSAVFDVFASGYSMK